jgi:hypothetical protein
MNLTAPLLLIPSTSLLREELPLLPIRLYGLVIKREIQSSDRLQAGISGLVSPYMRKGFLYLRGLRSAVESAKPPIQRVQVALSPGVKGPGHQTNKSPLRRDQER